MPSRSCAPCRRSSAPTRTQAAERATALFERLVDQDDSDDDQGSGARQAVHEHLALHEVRGRQPVLHDRPRRRRRLQQRPARDPRGLPSRAGPAGARVRGGSLPVQGRDAARRLHHRPFPDGPVRDADQRGPARLHRLGAASVATAACAGKTVGILGMAFKAESDDQRASLSYKLRKLLVWAGARVPAPILTSTTTARPARVRARRERHPGPRRAARALPRPADRRQGRRRRVGRPRRGYPP